MRLRAWEPLAKVTVTILGKDDHVGSLYSSEDSVPKLLETHGKWPAQKKKKSQKKLRGQPPRDRDETPQQIELVMARDMGA